MDTNELLLLHAELIKRHAQVALKKIKKPANCDLDDLIQEGALVFLYAEKRYVDRGASFKTYLTRCLRNHFANLVKRSYRNKEVNNIPFWNNYRIDDLVEKMVLTNNKGTVDTFETVQVSFIIENFNEDELEYVSAVLSFTHIPRKSRRKHARETLGISYERETELRRSIHDKIRK